MANGTWKIARGRGNAQLPLVIVVALAVVLVLFAGNQGGALEIVTGLVSPLAMDGRDLARAVQNGLGTRDPLYLQHPYQEWGAPDMTTVLTPTDMVANFNWWNPSRAVWDSSREPDGSA